MSSLCSRLCISAILWGHQLRTDLTSAAGAPFCCPVIDFDNWTPGTYIDTTGVEGAHSCLAYSPGSVVGGASPFVSLNQACQSKVAPSAHLLTSSQTLAIWPNVNSGVLSAAAQLTANTNCANNVQFIIGGDRGYGVTQATQWVWADNTNSSTVNCGAQGCGLWKPNEPSGQANAVVLCMYWYSGCGNVIGLDDCEYVPVGVAACRGCTMMPVFGAFTWRKIASGLHWLVHLTRVREMTREGWFCVVVCGLCGLLTAAPITSR